MELPELFWIFIYLNFERNCRVHFGWVRWIEGWRKRMVVFRRWSYMIFFFNRTLNITNCQHALETLWKVSITAPNYISASSFVSDENILVKLSKPKTNSFYLIFRGIILIQILISNRYFEIINIEYMHYFKRF